VSPEREEPQTNQSLAVGAPFLLHSVWGITSSAAFTFVSFVDAPLRTA